MHRFSLVSPSPSWLFFTFLISLSTSCASPYQYQASQTVYPNCHYFRHWILRHHHSQSSHHLFLSQISHWLSFSPLHSFCLLVVLPPTSIKPPKTVYPHSSFSSLDTTSKSSHHLFLFQISPLLPLPEQNLLSKSFFAKINARLMLLQNPRCK